MKYIGENPTLDSTIMMIPNEYIVVMQGFIERRDPEVKDGNKEHDYGLVFELFRKLVDMGDEEFRAVMDLIDDFKWRKWDDQKQMIYERRNG
jgi:hypothetical protein